MKKYLEVALSAAKLTKEINDPNSEFYFASLQLKIIGYLKINIGSSQTELHDVNALEIERIYVLSEFQCKKVGQKLYEKAIQIAQQKNAGFIWLGVWEKNQRAINFYTKNGFAAFDKHIFLLGDEVQTDIMMKIQLTESDLRS
jgi:ribosomal protein S18 acetylase RimI-like enzyme